MKKYFIFRENSGSLLSSNSSGDYYGNGSFGCDQKNAFDFETKKNAMIRLRELKQKFGNVFIKFKIVVYECKE